MTKDEQIVEGDRVSVYWENVQNVFNVEVLHAAQGPGDVWVFKEDDTYDKRVPVGDSPILVRRGAVHYVMSYSRITKVFVNEHPNPRKGVTLGPHRDSIFPSGGG